MRQIYNKKPYPASVSTAWDNRKTSDKLLKMEIKKALGESARAKHKLRSINHF
jgi:hypothetical protein